VHITAQIKQLITWLLFGCRRPKPVCKMTKCGRQCAEWSACDVDKGISSAQFKLRYSDELRNNNELWSILRIFQTWQRHASFPIMFRRIANCFWSKIKLCFQGPAELVWCILHVKVSECNPYARTLIELDGIPEPVNKLGLKWLRHPIIESLFSATLES
jgi:hypothetical protein